ncbi:leucyl aminopeptidase [Aestuariimicrobium sp. T2.26MG-19.2B]|uniref:leucyl aminopeptidase n=1 Tax=Aestuariimicrobium sp. T2.26MG-19.2B TaxID=3040679 RepID=UPI002477BF53|nr:leucyl aminopeptidase [Aestuariimicrobium sp. T2.26MG-19.2B]CAI9399804.1 putative cytosol aminopeptidase [Aestuariimicrobium sp. T2.26MG-19.2B]
MSALAPHQAPSVSVVKQPSEHVDVLVVGLADGTRGPVPVGLPDAWSKAYSKQFGDLATLALDLGGSSTENTVTVLPRLDGTRLLAVGLGNPEVTPQVVRAAAGAAVRRAASLVKDTAVTVAISLDLADPELVQAATEGALLGGYTFDKVSSEPGAPGVRAVEIVVSASTGAVQDAVTRGQHVAGGVTLARDWINAPANLLYPETFAAEARAAVSHLRSVQVEVLDEKELTKQGYGGILAVGGGSSRAPRLTRLEYKPRGAKRTLALVGKGITFDSGGLDIKPADGMYTMKCDMSGAAAVIAAVKVIAELQLPVHVIGYASMAENMPSGSAYRPSDVLTMFGGTTVENVNTDAEGRLVMADALARASQDAPDLLVDVATLTGACMIALGLRTAGVMASDHETAETVLDAAEAAGEEFWQLPIPQHLRKSLDSKVADLKSGGPRYGGALTAAAFLQRFVGGSIPWAHLDIAGPAFNDDEPYGHVSTGGTGAAVSTLVALAASLGR